LTVLAGLCLILPGVYLFVAWFFTLLLITDKRLEFWPAMRLSRKTISMHWWKFLGFLLVLMLINVVGMMTLCVGVFVTIPVSLAALMYAYEDIYNPLRTSATPATGSGSGSGGGGALGFFFALMLPVFVLMSTAPAALFQGKREVRDDPDLHLPPHYPESGARVPHSKTLARARRTLAVPPGFGVRRPCGAFLGQARGSRCSQP
jgi:hypothetical protein